jgi:hypothetical protein
MINTQLETIVELVMNAYKNTHSTSIEYMKFFELELRKNLMQKYCNTTPTNNTHTYTITPGTPMGKWTTRECPPSTSTGTILHG